MQPNKFVFLILVRKSILEELRSHKVVPVMSLTFYLFTVTIWEDSVTILPSTATFMPEIGPILHMNRSYSVVGL